MHTPGDSFLRTIPEDRSESSSTAARLVLPTTTGAGSVSSSVRGDLTTTARSVLSATGATIPEGDETLPEQHHGSNSISSSKFWSRRNVTLVLGGLCLCAGVVVGIAVVGVRAKQTGPSIVDDTTTDPGVTSNTTLVPTASPLLRSNAPTSEPTTAASRSTELTTTTPAGSIANGPTSTSPPTAAPTLNPEIVEKLDTVLFQVSEAALFAVPNSTHNLARHWMLHKDYLRDDVLDAGAERILQRYALVYFHYSTGLMQMLDDESECNWLGVICSDDDIEDDTMVRVQRLIVEEQELTGTLPSELGLLTSLQALGLSNNSFTGSIPSLEPFQELYWLDLSINRFNDSIPASTWTLPALRFLYLHRNILSGSIPTELDNHSKFLVDVWLHDNVLSGSIPQWFSNLPNLSTWLIWDNQLTGKLPAMLPTSLQQFDVSFNELVGPLPTTWTQMSQLNYLYLDQNQLTGQLPMWTDAESLMVLWLNDNLLEGEIPPNYALEWGNLTKLYLFNNTGLTGSLGPTTSADQCGQVWPNLVCFRADVPCACCREDCGQQLL